MTGSLDNTYILCIIISVGFILDILFGDPIGRFHPVCFIGRLISFFDKRLNKPGAAPRRLFIRGAVSAIITIVVTFTVSGGLLFLTYRYLGIYAYIAISVILADTTLAMGDLKKESMNVVRALAAEGIDGGRKAVSAIVGRDTAALDEAGVLRAAVETVAESTTDGIVSPLFYLFIGGPVLALTYKAVNTLDSMIGYKSDKYLYFGRTAARIDDVFNFIPSRIAGFFFCVSAFICGRNGKDAFRIWRRDRRNHESPNSAQTESACAGALGLRLGGNASYFGVMKEKKYIGDDIRDIERADVKRANDMMLVTAFLALVTGAILRTAIMILIYGVILK